MTIPVTDAASGHARIVDGVVTQSEVRKLAHLIASARDDPAAWNELLDRRREYRELQAVSERSKNVLGNEHRWPAIGTPEFLPRLRAVKSLHVPLMLRGKTKLMTHQLVNRLYLGPGTGFNGLLLIHDTGTGKTRTAIAIAEQHAHVMANKACVVGPGNVRPQFRAEIASAKGAVFKHGRWELDPSRWVGSAYASAARRIRNPRRSALESQLSAMVAARYEFHGWTGFANEWFRKDHHRRVKAFSDRVIIVDEAHNLRPRKGRDAAKHVTKALKEIAKQCFNVKIVLMTATPMFDRAEEIVDMVNILRLNDDRPELDVNKLFPASDAIDESALRDGVRGYISMFRRDIPDRRVPECFDVRSAKVPGTHTVWPKSMRDGSKGKGAAAVMHHIPSSKLQQAHPALRADPSRSASASASEGAEATNAVFPGGSSGQRGFLTVFNVRSGSYAPGYEGMFGPSRLAEVSPKANFIVESVQKCSGVAVVFSNFVWAGVKLLAAALEERGFRPCEYETAITKAARGRTSGPVYATLADGSQVEHILERARSKDNVDGKLIKVLLCTKVVAEGMDMAFVRELHIFEGWWNLSRESQIIGRAVRLGSHDDLPPERRNVTVFRYGLTLPGNREGFDHEMARMASQKQSKIDRVMHVLRAESFDCTVYKRQALDEARRLPVKGGIVRHVTSRGVQVRIKSESRPQVLKRLGGLCDGATMEVGKVKMSATDIESDAFQDILSSVRDSLGDGLKPGVIYDLGQLVDLTGLPDDIAVRSITEILHHGLPLTPATSGHHDTNLGKSLIIVDEDEYALAETQDGRHSIVTVPMVFDAFENEVPLDWHAISDELYGSLKDITGSDPDRDIVDDMAIDRVLSTRSDRPRDREKEMRVSKSFKRAMGLDEAAAFAKLSSDQAGLVFLAKRGAACSHMSRNQISKTLQMKGVAAPPDGISRASSCLYAEYELRKLKLVARLEAGDKAGRSDGHEDEADGGQKHT